MSDANARYQEGLQLLGVSSGEEKKIRPAGTNVAFTDADSGTYGDRQAEGYRLLGFDAPETAHASTQSAPEPLAYAARDEMASLIEQSGGAHIESTGKLDSAKGGGTYGRELAVMRGEDGRDLNAELIRTGSVSTPVKEPSAKYRDAFFGANLRTATDFGDLLTGDSKAVNERVRGLQQEAFKARAEGRLGDILTPESTGPSISTSRKAWTRGVDNLNAGVAGFSAAVGDTLGLTGLKDWSEAKMARALQNASAFPAEVQNWDDIQSLNTFGTFALERLLENAPNLVADAAAMLGTGGTSLALRVGFAKALSRQLGTGTLDAVKTLALRDAKVGATSSMYSQSVGETANTLHEAGVEDYGPAALVAGVPKTALEYYGLRNIVKGKSFVGNVAAEGGTEGVQSVVDNIAKNYKTGEDVFSEANTRDVITSALAGAVVGGAIGGVHHGVPAAYNAVRNKYFSEGGNATPSTVVPTAPHPDNLPPGPEGASGGTPAVTPDGDIVTAREPHSDVGKQIERFASGEKDALYLSAANSASFDQLRAAAPGAIVIQTDEGMLATHALNFDQRRYTEASPAEREDMRAAALGYTDSKSVIDPTTAVTVQTRDADGAIIQQELANEHRVSEVVAKQKVRARPTDTVEVADAQTVMQERQDKVNAEQQSTSANDSVGTDVLHGEQLGEKYAAGSPTENTGAVDSGVPRTDAIVGEVGETGLPTNVRAALPPVLGGESVPVPTSGVRNSRAGRVDTPLPLQTTGSEGYGSLPANPSDGAGDPVLAGDSPAVYADARGAGSAATYRPGQRGEDLPAVSLDSPKLNVAALTQHEKQQVASRLGDSADTLHYLLRAFMAAGASQSDALAHALAHEKVASSDNPQVLPINSGAEVDEDALAQQEGVVIEDQYAAEDLDEAFTDSTQGRALAGKLLGLHITFQQRAWPTREIRKIPAGKDKRGNTRFHIDVSQKKTFPTEAAAQQEAERLKPFYSMQVFIPHQENGAYHLTRNQLMSGATDNVDPIQSWFHQAVPAFALRTTRHEAEMGALQKRMDSAATEVEYRDLSAQYAAKELEMITLLLNKVEVRFHAPTLTQYGQKLIASDVDKTTSLEYYGVAFQAALGALHLNGYSAAFTDPRDIGNIVFTPTSEKRSLTDISMERSARQAEGYDLPRAYDKQIADLDLASYNLPPQLSQAEREAMRADYAAQKNALYAQKRESLATYARESLRTAQDGFAGDFTDMASRPEPSNVSYSDIDAANNASVFEYESVEAQHLRAVIADKAINTKPFARKASGPTAGLPVQEVQQYAYDFLQEFPGANDVKVQVLSVQTDFSNGAVKATYAPATDTMTLVASNFSDAADVRASLQHEIFVHKGLGFLSDTQLAEALVMVESAIASDPKVARIYAQLTGSNAAYKSRPKHVQLEEVIAFIAEGLNTGLVARTWGKVLSAMRTILRSLGIVKNVPDINSIQSLIQRMADGFRRGERARTRASTELMMRSATAARFGNFTASKVASEVRNAGAGLRKLAMPMMSGLYQLNDLSAAAGVMFRRYYALRNSARALWEGEFQNRVNLTAEETNNAWRELVDVGEGGDLSTISANARKLRVFLDRFYSEFAKTHMPTLGRIPNYVPQLIDIRELAKRKDEFLSTITGGKLANGERITEAQAEGIYKRLASNNGSHENALEDFTGVIGVGNDHRHTRMLRSPEVVAKLETAGFLYADKREVIDHYLTTSVNRGAFERAMGGYRSISGIRTPSGRYNDARLKELFEQAGRIDLATSTLSGEALANLAVEQGYARIAPTRSGKPTLEWYAPTQKLSLARDRLADATARARMDEIMQGMMGYFGSRVSPEVQKFQSNIMAYESLLTLAGTTLSSFQDFSGAFLRIMQDKGVAASLSALRDSLRTLAAGNYAQTKAQAREFGFINHRQAQAALRAVWGQEHYSPSAQKVLDGLFKYNGQEWLTNQSRVFSFGVGVNYFKTLAASADSATLAQYGLSPGLVQHWVKLGEPALSADILSAGGPTAGTTQAMHNALHKFVDESILRPDASDRPVWANDPRFALFWHLKSFMWAYWNRILSPTGRSIILQAQQGNYGEAAAQMALTGLLILPMAALGWELRELIQYSLFGEDTPSEKMDGFAYADQLISRGGLLGPFQMAFDGMGQGSATEGVVRIGGPTLDHAWTLLHGEWDEKFYRSIPLLSQLYGAQKNISGGL